MPYNIRSRNRQDQLPKEVWLQIFSFLKADPTPFDWQMYHYDKPTNYNFETLKKVSLVSKTFNDIVKQLIWKLPRLKQPLTLKQLKEVVALNAPIREMKLSHFVFIQENADKEIKELVDYICNNMHLNAFYMDGFNRYITENEKRDKNFLKIWGDRNFKSGDISLDSFRYCLQNLPIRNIMIGCFCFNPETQKFHEYLMGLDDACPEITLSRFSHQALNRDTKEEMDCFVARKFPESFQRTIDEQDMRMERLSRASKKYGRK